VNTFQLSTRISSSPSLFASHPYLTPTRHIPYFSPDFYSTPLRDSWDHSIIFCFTRTPHIPDFRPTFLSTSPELRSATPARPRLNRVLPLYRRFGRESGEKRLLDVQTILLLLLFARRLLYFLMSKNIYCHIPLAPNSLNSECIRDAVLVDNLWNLYEPLSEYHSLWRKG
jgi:hypothetical protein